MSVILGIDPGSQITGYGVIQKHANSLSYLASGCINAKQGDMGQRLAKIFIACNQLIEQYKPDIMAIEKAFMAKNPNVAIVLGQARGVAMVAASSQNIPVFEYAPRLIKKAVVGNGAAIKSQVQHMVSVLLGLSKVPPTDAADALAVAICHSHYLQSALK
jgi:crossover junction endodeoxyribonuclease RuvC